MTYAFEYRGYLIRPGTIDRNGETAVIFICPLEATKEEVFALGRQVIDNELKPEPRA